MPEVIWTLIGAVAAIAAAGTIGRSIVRRRRRATRLTSKTTGPKGPVPRPPLKRPLPAVRSATAKAPKQRSTAKSSPKAIQPGEIWIARVPFHGEAGSKVRPCVVLRANADGAEVLKITSQDHMAQGDHIEISTKGWDSRAKHSVSYLDLSDPYEVAARDFHKKIGAVEDAIWAVVREWHDVPELDRQRA